MAAWMLHGLCFGEEAGERNVVFLRVKLLQATMKGTSCVRRVRLRSFRTRLVPSMCFATSGCSCGVVLWVSWSCGCRWRRWKVPRVCDGCGCGRSGRDWFLLCVWLFLWCSSEAVVADRIVMAAWMLHGLCFGEEAGARNLVFSCVKWLQATMKGTSCVRRVRLRSFRTRLVPSMCFATSGTVPVV